MPMRSLGVTLAALAAGCVASGTREAPSSRQPERARAEVAVRAGRVLDPVAGRYDQSVVILVRNKRIAEIIPARDYRAEMADSLVDLGQLTVLPGLIDGHVHLVIGGAVAANALADLRAGFTTVVDLGARTHRLLQLRDSINAGHIPGPRVLAAGIWVGRQGGVCEFNGIGIVGGAEEFRARIRANALAGAEIAKLCLSGWPGQAFAEPASYELPDDVIRASVAEARGLGQITLAHAISLGSVRAALDAGVDGLAHTAYVDSAVALRMRDRHMFMVSTLASLTNGDTSIVARSLVSALSLAARNGVPIVFGTDGGVLPHGRNAEELRALVNAGLSPLEAIRAATVNAARAFSIQDSIGTIESGKVADLIAVAGDPLADIGTLGRPVLVMSRGRIVRDDRAIVPDSVAIVRRELDARYAENEAGFFARDADRVMRLRHPAFHTITPDGSVSNREQMYRRTREFIGRIERFDSLSETITELTLAGDTAHAIVDQRTVRQQRLPDGALHEVRTSVIQRESWIRTPEGWLLWRVDRIQPGQTLVDGQPVR